MTQKAPDPKAPDPKAPEEQDASSHVGPGGPDFDDSVQPQSGTPADPSENPPAPQEEDPRKSTR